MSLGLQWMRHRQRRLARALLPLFGLVWLQLAAVPCIGAHQAAAEVASSTALDHMDSHHDAGTDHDHCPYCPPAGQASDDGSCDDGAQCAYPHEPGVDARAVLAVLPTPMATPLASLLEAPRSEFSVLADRPDPIPRCSLAVSYCRFIE
jgi:hypothetical protein